MANYSVAKSKHATLVAATADQVTITADVSKVMVVNEDGAAAIYATADGTAATVAGDNTVFIPAQAGAFALLNADGRNPVVSVISAGTPKYSVLGGNAELLDFGSGAHAVFVDPSGRQVVRQRADTGTPTSVAANVASVTILAANTLRLGGSVFADSIGSATLYLLLVTGGTASAATYSVALTSSAPYFEIPAGYTGAIIGIWSVANGAAKVTEFTA